MYKNVSGVFERAFLFIATAFVIVVVFSIPFWIFNVSFLDYLSLVYLSQVFLFWRIKKGLFSKKNISAETKEFVKGNDFLKKFVNYVLSPVVLFPLLLCVWVPQFVALINPNHFLARFSTSINEMFFVGEGPILAFALYLIVSLFVANNLYYYKCLG